MHGLFTAHVLQLAGVASGQLPEGASSPWPLPSSTAGTFFCSFHSFITEKLLQGAWGWLGGRGVGGFARLRCTMGLPYFCASQPSGPLRSDFVSLQSQVWLPLVYICLEGSGSKKHNHFLASLPVSAASREKKQP